MKRLYCCAGLIPNMLLALGFVLGMTGCSQAQCRHHEHVVFRGTRSQGKVWLLSCSEQEVLPYTTAIRTPDGKYQYEYREIPFSRGGGWKRVIEEKQNLKVLPENVTSDDIKRGWYSCKKGEQKSGTPESWLWVPSYRIWVSPDHINDAAVYSGKKWKYVVEVVNRENWELRGRLFHDGQEVVEKKSSIQTPIGNFRWVKFNNCEWGWLRDKAAPKKATVQPKADK